MEAGSYVSIPADCTYVRVRVRMCVSDTMQSGPVDGSRVFPPIPRQARSESGDII